MGIKREFKKLLKDRKKKLRFTIMDQKFYQETNVKLLSVNVDELSDKILKIEAEMKARENWKGKEAMEEKAKLIREYQECQGTYGLVMGIRKKLSDLADAEEDYKKYILYLEAYINLKRWK